MFSVPSRNRTTYSDCPCCGYKNSLATTQKDGRPLYYCHAGCRSSDLWQVLCGGMLPAAHHRQEQRREADWQAKRARALKLWHESLPPDGTPVAAYLASRGITGAIPPALRFLPNALHTPTRTYWPVMLASVTDIHGRSQAAHRTYLAQDSKGKAQVEPPKMTLGQVGGLSCHLAPAEEELAITEGIETGLSVQLATGIPTWAALSAGGIRNLILPPLPLASAVTICADNDANRCGQDAAHEAAHRWREEGRCVKIALPPAGVDFNDLLMEGAP